MSETSASLSRKMRSAGDLQSVVRTMKALAASSIGQYEASVRALGEYARTVDLGLGVCLREKKAHLLRLEDRSAHRGDAVTDKGVRPIGAVVFGSDQGLVGQFNEVIAEHVVEALGALPGEPEIWAVGERVHARLIDAGLTVRGLFTVPTSIKAITPLVGQILVEHQALHGGDYRKAAAFYLFYNASALAAGTVDAPVGLRLLPLDANWEAARASIPWPSPALPEVVIGEKAGVTTLRGLIREYLFISLFRACAESLASENASRLAAMERADRNIDEFLEVMNRQFHQLRQSGIDAELFDVIAGFEALGGKGTTR